MNSTKNITIEHALSKMKKIRVYALATIYGAVAITGMFGVYSLYLVSSVQQENISYLFRNDTLGIDYGPEGPILLLLLILLLCTLGYFTLRGDYRTLAVNCLQAYCPYSETDRKLVDMLNQRVQSRSGALMCSFESGLQIF